MKCGGISSTWCVISTSAGASRSAASALEPGDHHPPGRRDRARPRHREFGVGRAHARSDALAFAPTIACHLGCDRRDARPPAPRAVRPRDPRRAGRSVPANGRPRHTDAVEDDVVDLLAARDPLGEGGRRTHRGCNSKTSTAPRTSESTPATPGCRMHPAGGDLDQGRLAGAVGTETRPSADPPPTSQSTSCKRYLPPRPPPPAKARDVSWARQATARHRRDARRGPRRMAGEDGLVACVMGEVTPTGRAGVDRGTENRAPCRLWTGRPSSPRSGAAPYVTCTTAAPSSSSSRARSARPDTDRLLGISRAPGQPRCPPGSRAWRRPQIEHELGVRGLEPVFHGDPQGHGLGGNGGGQGCDGVLRMDLGRGWPRPAP